MSQQQIHVSTTADASAFNETTLAADKQLDALAEKQLKIQRETQIRWIALAEVGTRILRTFEGNVAAQVAVKGLELAQFGLSIKRITLEAIAAAGLKNYAQAAMLAFIAGSMTVLKVESERQQYMLQNEQKRVAAIRAAMEGYQ